MQTAALAVLWRRGMARSRSGALAAAGALLVAVAGCGTVPLDQSRRHLVSAGIGGASLQEGWSSTPDPVDLHGSWAVHGAYDFRLTGPDAWLGVFARAVTYAVLGTSVSGEGITRPCDLFWAMAGPSIGVQAPASSSFSFVGDAGIAFAHVSRSGCSHSGRSTATAFTPQAALGVQDALAPRLAWRFGGRWIRLPLDAISVGSEPRWAGIGEFSLIVAF